MCLPSDLFFPRFPTKILHLFIFSPMLGQKSCSCHPLEFDLIGEQYKSCSCNLRSFLQSPLIVSLSTLLWHTFRCRAVEIHVLLGCFSAWFTVRYEGRATSQSHEDRPLSPSRQPPKQNSSLQRFLPLLTILLHLLAYFNHSCICDIVKRRLILRNPCHHLVQSFAFASRNVPDSYNYTSCFVWMSNSICHIKGRTETAGSYTRWYSGRCLDLTGRK